MSWLGDRLGLHVQVPGLRQVGGVYDKGIQKVADIQSNPWVQGLEAAALGATGVGAPAAAALLAASGGLSGLAKKGGGAGQALSGALQGGVAGGAGALAGGALKGGLSLGGIGGALGKIPGAISGAAGLAGKALGGGSGGGMNLGSLVDPLLGGAQALNAANLQKQSTGYATGALDTANKSYDERAPLRTAGIQGMLNPGAGIDLSSLRKTASHNSFASAPSAPPSSGPATPSSGGAAMPNLPPQFMGKAVTAGQAQAGMDAFQNGPGGLSAKLRAARAAVG